MSAEKVGGEGEWDRGRGECAHLNNLQAKFVAKVIEDPSKLGDRAKAGGLRG